MGDICHHVLKRQRVLNIIEFLKEVYAFVTGKITIGLRIGQAESLSEITDNRHDIWYLPVHTPQSYENYFLFARESALLFMPFPFKPPHQGMSERIY